MEKGTRKTVCRKVSELLDNRYAYVEHKTVVKNNAGNNITYKLTFDVDVNGDYHTNTHFKNANIDVTKG